MTGADADAGKAGSSSMKPGKKATAGKTKEKAVKKVYSLPGQKHDPPEERDSLRIFYESLYRQIPTSEMATNWMMEHGLLPYDKAKKAFERKQRKQQQQRTGTPLKSPALDKKSSNDDVRTGPTSSKRSLPLDERESDFGVMNKRKPL